MRRYTTLRRTRLRRGVTLVEILTVSSLFLVLLTGVMAVGLAAAGAYSAGSAKITADNQAGLALEKMCREMRNGVRATVNSPTDLSVVVPYINAQGDYERYTEGSTLRYYLSNENVYRQVDTAASTLFVRGVAGLAFATESTPDGLCYRVSLTCRRQSGQDTKSTTIATTLSLRNEHSL